MLDKTNGISQKPRKSSTQTRKKKAKKGESDEENGEKRNTNSGFNKPVKISPELQEIVGKEYVSRPELTKILWTYFKDNNL